MNIIICNKCDGHGELCALNKGTVNPNLCIDAHDGECELVLCPWCGGDGEVPEDQEALLPIMAEMEIWMVNLDTSEEEELSLTNMNRLELHLARQAVTRELVELNEMLSPKTERGRTLHARREVIAELFLIRSEET